MSEQNNAMPAEGTVTETKKNWLKKFIANPVARKIGKGLLLVGCFCGGVFAAGKVAAAHDLKRISGSSAEEVETEEDESC